MHYKMLENLKFQKPFTGQSNISSSVVSYLPPRETTTKDQSPTIVCGEGLG